MSNIELIKREGLALNESDRAELALTLVQSLHGSAEEGVELAWNDEIERRVAEIKRGELRGRGAEDVFNELRSLYP